MLQVLFRKGGIREPTFQPKAKRFLLFPTAFHSDAQLLKPGVAEQFHQVSAAPIGGELLQVRNAGELLWIQAESASVCV